MKKVEYQKNKDILISVIVPLYNVEMYMEKCIDSIIAQTFEQIEIILVDDGSPDNSGAIADEYAKRYNNIKVIHKLNGGLSSARNAGMKIAKGSYILFVDSDDWISPNLLEKTYQKITETNAQICVFNVLRINEDTQKSFKQAKDVAELININKYGVANYIKNYLLNPHAHRYSAWNRLYESEFLLKNKLQFEPNNEIHSEDMLFNLQCSMFVERVCTINEPLYFHLLREGTISSSKKPDLTKKLMTLVQRFIDYTKKNNVYEEAKAVIPHITQYSFFMAMGSEVNINKLKFYKLFKVIKSCYKFDFFHSSMRKMSKEKLSKRSMIAKTLRKKMIFTSTMILFYGLKK